MAELGALQTIVGEIGAAGAQLIAVSPQLPEHSRRIEERLKLDFPVWFDRANRAADEWGLTFEFSDDLRETYAGLGMDLPKHHGTDPAEHPGGGWTLPMPARFVIDAGGIARQAEVHPDYKIRPEPEATLEVVRGLA